MRCPNIAHYADCHYAACPFVRSLYEVCTKFVRSLYEVCTKFVRSLYEVCTKFVRSLYEVCTKFVRSLCSFTTKHENYILYVQPPLQMKIQAKFYLRYVKKHFKQSLFKSERNGIQCFRRHS
jgi:hypothetical protein